MWVSTLMHEEGVKIKEDMGSDTQRGREVQVGAPKWIYFLIVCLFIHV